jgi:hypothetical protein
MSFFDAFTDEFLNLTFVKEAELTPEEAKAFKDAVRNHASFETQTRAGTTDQLNESMRHNIERMKHFKEKKKDSNYKIPSWVLDPSAAPPAAAKPRSAPDPSKWKPESSRWGGEGPEPANPAYKGESSAADPYVRWMMDHPHAAAAIGGGLYGGMLGASVGVGSLHHTLNPATNHLRKNLQKSDNRVARFVGDHPVLSGTAVGGGLGALTGYGLSKLSAIGATTMLPGATAAAKGIGGSLKGLVNKVPTMASNGVSMLQEAGNAARDESVRALQAVKLPGFSGAPARPSMPPGATMPVKAMPKVAFNVSQYSGPLSYGPFKQESSQPGFRPPSLKAPVEKKASDLIATLEQVVEDRVKRAAAAITPAGLLSQTRSVGVTPKVTAPPGPSIAQVAKPVGFGKPAPGALKTGI